MKTLRIGFMGTPDFALAALDALHTAENHEVACVYTQPPRPKGRGQRVQLSSVHEYAEAHGLPVFTPKNFKSETARMEFIGHNLDVAVVAAYGLILPPAILDAPRYGCINIHASLLPRWRGASPVQQAIWAGDAESGISIMQMDRGLDTGPVIERRAVPIRASTTASSLHDTLAALGGAMIEEIMDRLAAEGGLHAELQDEAQATYAPRLTKEDGRIDWSRGAAELGRQIRALNPWPGAWCEYGGAKIKIMEAVYKPHHNPSPASADAPAPSPIGRGRGPRAAREDEGVRHGLILDRAGRVACGGGTILQIAKIQPQGARAMDFPAAVNGGYVKVGENFS